MNQTQLKEIAQIMATASGANKIILFGSRARGDFDASSDWDFLLVINDSDWQWNGNLLAKLKPAGLAKQAARKAGFCFPMDILSLPNSRFEETDSLLGNEVKRDGIILFDRTNSYG